MNQRSATIHNPEVVKPVQAIGQRLRGRLTSISEEGIEQLMMWLAMDGLFLWQFVGLLSSDDPLIDQVHANLLAKLEHASGGHGVASQTIPSKSKTSVSNRRSKESSESPNQSERVGRKPESRAKKKGGG